MNSVKNKEYTTVLTEKVIEYWNRIEVQAVKTSLATNCCNYQVAFLTINISDNQRMFAYVCFLQQCKILLFLGSRCF